MRLDRWFKTHYPMIGHGRLEKLLRTGQVRVDGGRAKAGQRIETGARIRIPPLGDDPAGPPKDRRGPRPSVSREDIAALEARILHMDDHVIVINKPAGLPVQGGSKTTKHLDGMLGALQYGKPERPRLVHRLDKDTSGVLVLARDRRTATRLGDVFRSKSANKLYWALVAGVPRPRWGRIDAPLEKLGDHQGERVEYSEGGKRAITEYAVIEAAGSRAAWLVLRPLTGRTHQLRVHCKVLGTPIVGDGKYGGSECFLSGVSGKMHLHARSISIPLPSGKMIEVSAPIDGHMLTTWKMFDFNADYNDDPFADALA